MSYRRGRLSIPPLIPTLFHSPFPLSIDKFLSAPQNLVPVHSQSSCSRLPSHPIRRWEFQAGTFRNSYPTLSFSQASRTHRYPGIRWASGPAVQPCQILQRLPCSQTVVLIRSFSLTQVPTESRSKPSARQRCYISITSEYQPRSNRLPLSLAQGSISRYTAARRRHRHSSRSNPQPGE